MKRLLIITLCLLSTSVLAEVTDNDMKKGYMAWVVLNGEVEISTYTANHCKKLDPKAGQNMLAEIRSWQRKEFRLFQQLQRYETRLKKTLAEMTDEQKQKIKQERADLLAKKITAMDKKFAEVDNNTAIQICQKMDPSFSKVLASITTKHNDIYQHMLATQW